MFALVTCRAARDVDTDLPLLERELPEAMIVYWDDDSVDWSGFDHVVIRSTWDYHTRRDAFLAWAAAVGDVAPLWNSLPLIEWNTDKRYLVELAGAGVPIVATTFLEDDRAVDALAEAGGFAGDLIVKPTVGASAVGVIATRGDECAAIAHARRLLATGSTPMVQPYLAGIDEHGETGLVYLAGEFSHAFRRRVVMRTTAAFDGDVLGEERSEAWRATDAERSVGDAVVATLPPTAYARIDLVPTPSGPVVLEVEVTEPSLFLHLDAGAPARAAAAFRSLEP